MITNIPKYEDRAELIRTIVELGVEPWLGKADWVAVGKEIGTTANGARNRFRRLLEQLSKNNLALREFKEFALASNKSVPMGTENAQPDEDFQTAYLRELGYDPDKFKLVPKSMWDGPGGEVKKSFRVVPTGPEDETLDVSDVLVEVQRIMNPPKEKAFRVSSDAGDEMAVFSLYDPHFGKLTVNGEDMIETYRRVLSQLVGQVVNAQINVSKAVLVIGQDYVNFDNVQGNTTAGTPQQNVFGWREAVSKQVAITTWAVEQLREHFPHVEVHHVPGNHSLLNDEWLYRFMCAHYDGYPDVQIFGGKDWSVIHHGSVGIFSIHGHEGKGEDYMDIWARFSPKTFAETEYREIHTGHLHTRKEVILDKKGVVHRYMPGLCAPDDWHKRKLYIGNNRFGLVTCYNRKYPTSEFYAFPEGVYDE